MYDVTERVRETKEQARYRAAPKEVDRNCGNCLWFRSKPSKKHIGKCIRVRGQVGNLALCDRWELFQ